MFTITSLTLRKTSTSYITNRLIQCNVFFFLKNIFLPIANNTGTNLWENIKDYQMVTTYA